MVAALLWLMRALLVASVNPATRIRTPVKAIPPRPIRNLVFVLLEYPTSSAADDVYDAGGTIIARKSQIAQESGESCAHCCSFLL